ncbi:hypothetical protein EPO15_15235, partial [bacterium]
MRGLVVLLAATGCALLVFWFWQQQLIGRVEPMPPLVAQLEKLVEAGAFGGQSPEGLVATLVFSEPFKESDPWDLAPRRKGGMSAMFGEPRETAFLAALGREDRTAAWRLGGADAASAAEAQAQMSAALAWAAEKGVRLRVVAHGAALAPVLRAALAAPASDRPPLERLLGVGVRLADLKAREPELAAALDARPPAGQWFDLFSEAAVVPRELALERVTPGGPPELAELAWPGSSWVPTVLGLVQRGAPQAAPAMPSAAPGSQQSVRQFRSAKEGLYSQRVVDGKGHLVSGSLLVPKLAKEEIPPDPEAAENKAGDPAAGAPAAPGKVALGDSGWAIQRVPGFVGLAGTKIDCGASRVLLQDARYSVTLQCLKEPRAAGGMAAVKCASRPKNVVRFNLKGRPVAICKEVPPGREFKDGNWSDYFEAVSGDYAIDLSYSYPDGASRGTRLDDFMKAIDALV